MKTLWGKKIDQLHEAEHYCFGDTAVLDNQLIFQDVLGSLAHIQMLCSIGLLSRLEYEQLQRGLKTILALHQQGKFVVSPDDEDVHTKVEAYLSDTLGEVGKKVHTGRSRNDQILTDLRLYTKDQFFRVTAAYTEFISACIAFATAHEWIPIVGYTHMQRAMPSSVGMWMGSFVESGLDDLSILQSLYLLNDQSPLGTGAAYGVPLPLDRQLTATLLGFTAVQNNSLYAQCSRGKSHAAVLHGLTQVMLTLSRLAQDLLLFTTAEFNFFSVGKDLCTGSSIMPQKNNLDVMEFVRARTHQVIAHEQSVLAMIAGLPSGYNADFGETKYPLIKAFEVVLGSLRICTLTVNSLQCNPDGLHNSLSPEIFSTQAAYELVKSGMPFRDAYKKIGDSLTELPEFDAASSLRLSTHMGGTANLRLSDLSEKLIQEKKWWNKKQSTYKKAIVSLGGQFV